MQAWQVFQSAARVLNGCIRPLGVTIVRTDTLSRLHKRAGRGPTECSYSEVDDEDREALVPTNPRLLELTRRYDGASREMGEPTVWKAGYVRAEDLLYFRGDNAYVWQFLSGNCQESYLLTYFYLKQMDNLDLFEKLREDADYGVFACATGHLDASGGIVLVSRDLLDSINEILFLDRVLGISRSVRLRILDIGAGYGRLAHRFVSGFANIEAYYCIDAIPCSTFLCEYYLRRKTVTDRAIAIPLDEQYNLPGQGAITIAINIHSFSECPIAAVDYWCRRCAQLGIKYLFVVPNGISKNGAIFVSHTSSDGNFRGQIEAHGYKLVHAEPKYSNSEVQIFGVSPAWYFLFEMV
jgi:hypothetical protein